MTETVDRIAARRHQSAPLRTAARRRTGTAPAPKIFGEDCLIDWSWDGRRIVNFVRGFRPSGSLDGTIQGRLQMPQAAKIYSAAFEPRRPRRKLGSIESDGRTLLRVALVPTAGSPREIQIAGKKRLPVMRTAARPARHRAVQVPGIKEGRDARQPANARRRRLCSDTHETPWSNRPELLPTRVCARTILTTTPESAHRGVSAPDNDVMRPNHPWTTTFEATARTGICSRSVRNASSFMTAKRSRHRP